VHEVALDGGGVGGSVDDALRDGSDPCAAVPEAAGGFELFRGEGEYFVGGGEGVEGCVELGAEFAVHVARSFPLHVAVGDGLDEVFP